MNKNKIFRFNSNTYTVILENGIEDLYNIVRTNWGCSPIQIKYIYNKKTNYWDVYLTNKLGETFAMAGTLNFDPNEN